ncbi:MAG TPA: diguanylate cyclase [Burkholderiales bacterium]|nr:diguanylate cyclase [Burkholderiales bacterium]
MASSILSVGRPTRDDVFFSGVEQNPDAVMITDETGVIEYVNRAFESLTGYARTEAVGRTPAILKSGAHDAEFYRGLWRSILAGKSFHEVFVDRRKSGELFHAENLIWPVFNRYERITNFVCETRDVTERVRYFDVLSHAASHDPLTDLPNRTLFLDRLGQALHQAARRHEGLAVAILDIDRFRETNNRFGHMAGDAVLQAVARRSTRCVRAADTVARIGGDELALVLSSADKRAGASAVCEKVRAAAAVPVRFDGRLIGVSVSIGACVYPSDAGNAEELRKRADEAMYAAKRTGGNCVRFYRHPERR